MRGLDRRPNLHLSILHVCILLLLADQHLPACRCSRMPRFNGGIGRTGKKHKKVPKFDVHRQEKGDCGPQPASASTLDRNQAADLAAASCEMASCHIASSHSMHEVPSLLVGFSRGPRAVRPGSGIWLGIPSCT